MDGETWFYLIIVLISIIVSIIGRKQKKLQQQQQKQRQQEQQQAYSTSKTAESEFTKPIYESKKTDINDFFEMFKEAVNTEEEVEQEEYEEEQEQELIEKEEEPEILDSPESELDNVTEEGVSLIEKYDYNEVEDSIIDELEEEGFKPGDFDVKKAIIYSEILNRKHY